MHICPGRGEPPLLVVGVKVKLGSVATLLKPKYFETFTSLLFINLQETN